MTPLHQPFFFTILSALIHIVSPLNHDGVTLLLLLKHLTSPTSLNWNSSDSTPCSWQGILCDPQHNAISLNLSSSNLVGTLGSEIGGLQYLKSIDLYDNRLMGSIPVQLGNCSHLAHVDLSMNNFIGQVPPSLVNLRRLKNLLAYNNMLNGTILEFLFKIPRLENVLLNQNQFTGLIPLDIGNMSEIKSLWLDHNKFRGIVPFSIGNCTKLEELHLNDNMLVGHLPNSLNNLEFLTSVDVSSNGLDGGISFGHGNCKKLNSLILSFNRFRGEVPDLGNCTSLIEFTAVNNSLTGKIPSSLGLLPELSLLYLSGNSLSGEIPPEIGNCKSLVEFEVYENQLKGVVPMELGKCRKLETLWLYSNQLSGEFPAILWTAPALRSVIIYRNNLSGELPVEITELHELHTLLLYENQFSGVIPQGLGINSSLESLDFTNNKFIGEVPPNLCFQKQLRVLNLGLNQLEGIVPSDVGICSTLQRLILRQNSLTGFLPNFTVNSSILFMDISGNNINGTIPSSLGNCGNVSSINFSRNKLMGQIPQDLGNLVKLQVLNLSSNNLQGPLPPQISKCLELYSLDVGFNSLNGSIPVTLRSLTHLSLLILQQNQFTGEIPDMFSELNSLWEIQLGGNLLWGSIPTSVGNLQNLAYALNLSDNNLSGPIPRELSRVIRLERLDISRNNFSGSLSPLGDLHSLLELNVSANLFDGPIPVTLLKFLNSSPTSFLGNHDLCFPCQSSSGLMCNANNGLSPCAQSLPRDKKNGIGRVQIVIIVVGGLVLCVIAVSVLSYYFLQPRKLEHEEFDVFSRVGSSIELKKVLKATEGLSERFIIGRGAHGIVYKVSLGQEKQYAVKKLNFDTSKGASASMVRELQTIGKIRHRNLVKVKDFWFRKEHGLILYKYMQNGSLHRVLHEVSPVPIIKWDVRYKIALGIAQGLEYLHHDCDPVIVHRDIKPKNILLDSEMEAHISDFGIAKLIDQHAASTDSVSVVGTVGYLAPETAFTTIWSKESDVYSYGVVLLELITRKEAVDSSFQEGMDIVSWASSTWNSTHSIDGIGEQRLMEELDSSEIKLVNEIFLMALRCTDKNPNRRPSMRDVVKHLTDIKPRVGTETTG